MLTKVDFENAEKIIDGLHLPMNFGVEESDYFNDEYLLEDQVAALGIGDFAIDNGVSKAVIIPDNMPFVVKIPFNGIHYYIWDEEAEEYSDKETFEYFCRADAPDNSDYCWDELLKIERACMAGFEQLFPATEFVKEHDNFRIYIQEKVKTFRRGYTRVSKESRAKAEALDPFYRACDVEWRAAVIEFYGEDFWKHFVEWDSINCVGILTDMHGGNYGYAMDGRPVILDASGFRED